MRFDAALPALAALTLASGPAAAQPVMDHAAIDQAVERFTGAAIGAPGGARMPVDRRLRLASCPAPLDAQWSGTDRASVLLRCAVGTGWRLYVPVMRDVAPSAQQAISSGEAVAIILSGNGFTLTRQGEALEGGAVGDWIRVRPLSPGGARAKEAIRLRILRPGAVGIPLP